MSGVACGCGSYFSGRRCLLLLVKRVANRAGAAFKTFEGKFVVLLPVEFLKLSLLLPNSVLGKEFKQESTESAGVAN